MSNITITAIQVTVNILGPTGPIEWSVHGTATVPDDTKTSGVEELILDEIGGTVSRATFDAMTGAQIHTQAVNRVTTILQDIGQGGHNIIDGTT